MTPYQRIFGTGPRGILLSILLFGGCWWLAPQLFWPEITASQRLRYAALGIGIVGSLAIAAAAFAAMPPADRGTRLVTRGIYDRIRHPLYASLISCFNFGLAVWLNHWLFVVWALILHPFWHWNVRAEEAQMAKVFPDYPAYADRTGRFLPRLGARSPRPKQ